VVVDGNVDGPIEGAEVVLKSRAHVVGDVHHKSLSVESGAYFDGRSIKSRGVDEGQAERPTRKMVREIPQREREPVVVE
jgi:cytoskeletal protein CcmA (bactofilin family)